MPEIKDIVGAASYTGNKELGGYVPDVIAIDPRPLELLASYTVAYNIKEREQRQKDAEGQAKELAGIAAIDFSKIDDKWRQPIAEKFDKLTAFVKANPNVFNYQKNPEGFLEYSRMKDELGQAVSSGKANQIILEKRIGDVKAETDINLKEFKQNSLNTDKDKTGLYDNMPAEEQYDLTFDKLPNPALLKTSVVYKDPNGTQTTDYTMRDLGKINQQSQVFAMKDFLEQKSVIGTDEYKNASDDKKKLMEQQEKIRNIKREKDGWSPMGKIAKEIFSDPKYKDANGDISMDLLMKDPATTQLATAISSVNQQIAEQKAKIDAGLFTDKSGKALDSKDYYPIDFKDGLSGPELARMQMWINAAPETKDSKYAHDGDQNKKDIEAMGNKSKEKISAADNARALTIAREGNQNSITLASMKEAKAAVGKGTATPAQLEEYPIAKTREFELQIKGATKQVLFKDLTPEQRRIFKAANGGKNVDEKSVIKIEEGKISAFKGNGTKITDVNLDDISKIYYDENNKNDAGKEASQRIKYDQSLFDVPVAATAPAVPEQKNGKVKETTAAEKAKAAELIKKYTQ